MEKLTNMFSFFDKKKDKKEDMNDLGTFLPDDSDQPNNQPKQEETHKMKMFGDIPKKEEIIGNVKKQENKKSNSLFDDPDSDDIFKKEEKKEGKKIIGLFADIGTTNSKPNMFQQKKKEEIKNPQPKINMFDIQFNY